MARRYLRKHPNHATTQRSEKKIGECEFCLQPLYKGGNHYCEVNNLKIHLTKLITILDLLAEKEELATPVSN